ncbi:hypothetical protein B0I35DRAFT_43523 [Stachybotrys elegans]|uniref:Uncharacterized protein n=1 Tax=Stachybotrys elegans TaxID=80388 RepID=A0A8K0T3V9_9HYPO|nr:hypothetical protein B0I35DRAFT_43523 [Stachybotrys elegans]
MRPLSSRANGRESDGEWRDPQEPISPPQRPFSFRAEASFPDMRLDWETHPRRSEQSRVSFKAMMARTGFSLGGGEGGQRKVRRRVSTFWPADQGSLDTEDAFAFFPFLLLLLFFRLLLRMYMRTWCHIKIPGLAESHKVATHRLLFLFLSFPPFGVGTMAQGAMSR